MTKAEWELLRDLKRGLGYVSKVCAKVEKEVEESKVVKEELKSVQSRISDMEEVVEEMRDFLEKKKMVKRLVKWILVIVVSTALTTYTSFSVNGYLKQNNPALIREEGDTHGGVGSG